MFAAGWRHLLKDPKRSRSRRWGGARSRHRTKLIPTADALEDRQLLAVPLVTDHGGSILQNIQVETVYWNWNTPALKAMANQLNTFVGDVTNSPYWSGLAQYNVGSGSWAGEFDIAGAPPLTPNGFGGIPATTNANVEATLVASLGKGLPMPNPQSTLYLVYLPPGDPFNYTDGTGAFYAAASYPKPGNPSAWTVLLGQHAWNIANNFAYAVIPYPGAVGGGFSNPQSPDATSTLSFLTAVSSHELVEAATDAKAYINPNATTTAFGWYFTPPGKGPGWTGGGTEIGDPLTGNDVWMTMNNYLNPAVSDTWFVQLFWSNFIPLSTAPHDWPRVVARQTSIFKPSSPGTTSPPRPTPPAQPPLPNTTSPPPPVHTGPSIPGGAEPGPAGDCRQPHEPERAGRRFTERRGCLDQRRRELERAHPVPDRLQRRFQPRLQQERQPLLVLPEPDDRRHHDRDAQSEYRRGHRRTVHGRRAGLGIDRRSARPCGR